MNRKTEIIRELKALIPKKKEAIDLINELESYFPTEDYTYDDILAKMDRPLIFFDAETTGVDVQKDMFVEICMLKLHPDGREEIKTKRINPGIPIPKEASDVHGITNEMVKDAPTFVAISKGVMEFIDGCDIVGFNSNRFDVPMLFNMFQRFGLVWNWRSVRLVDVRNIYIQKEERTLSAAVQFYLGRNHEEAHSAEADIIATKEVFLKQIAMYPDLKEKNLDQIALYSNYDREIIDLDGFFAKNDEGVIVFAKGKHKDKVASTEKSYLTWMMDKGDFSSDTKNIAKRIFLGHI